MGSPRVDVVFRLWQCDKENHGWCEGPPVTVLCQSFRSAGRAFTLRLNQFQTKTRILLYVVGRQPPQNTGRFKTTRQDLSLQKRPRLGRPGRAKVRVGVFAQLDYFRFADNLLGK